MAEPPDDEQGDSKPAKKVIGRPFKAGNQANIHGRPRTDARLKESVARLSIPAIRELGKLLRDPTTPRKVRAQIAMYVVDRRLGRPTVAIGGVDGAPLSLPGAPTESALSQLLARVTAKRAATTSEAQATTAPENAPPGASGAATRGLAS